MEEASSVNWSPRQTRNVLKSFWLSLHNQKSHHLSDLLWGERVVGKKVANRPEQCCGTKASFCIGCVLVTSCACMCVCVCVCVLAQRYELRFSEPGHNHLWSPVCLCKSILIIIESFPKLQVLYWSVFGSLAQFLKWWSASVVWSLAYGPERKALPMKLESMRMSPGKLTNLSEKEGFFFRLRQTW